MWSLMWAFAVASEPVEPPEVDTLRRALSMRHPVPCEELQAGLAEPVEALRWAVEGIQQPPWAGMRAAECLTRHHAEAVQADLVRWVTEPQLKGLGIQTVGLLEVLPVAVAVPVAREALRGPVAERARKAVTADVRPEVAALVVAP
jgi:hypothetical protein